MSSPNPAPSPALERLRTIIAAWPETHEKISHGAPTWWGCRKTFARFASNRHNDGRVTVWVKSTFDEQALRVEIDPERYFVPPYLGPSGWIGMHLDQDPDWQVVEELLEAGYRLVALKRALNALDQMLERPT